MAATKSTKSGRNPAKRAPAVEPKRQPAARQRAVSDDDDGRLGKSFKGGYKSASGMPRLKRKNRIQPSGFGNIYAPGPADERYPADRG